MHLYCMFKAVRLFTFFILIFISYFVKANSGLPDSLVTRFNSINDNVERINQTRNEMRRLAFVDFDMAIELADFNINWALTTEDNFIIGKAFSEKSILYLMTLQYQKAKPIVKKGIYYLENTNDKKLIGYGYRNLGVTHFNLNDHDSSISAHFNALSFLDSTLEDHKLFYGLTCEELGKVFYESSNNASAEKYAKQALTLYSDIGDSA
jgi:tetratricopeptide (TPR) repeat protein